MNYGQHKKMKTVLFRAVCLSLVMLIAFLLLDARVRPMIRNTAIVQAQSYAALAAGQNIPDILRQTGISYESMVDIQRDANGNIVSIQTNAMQLNALKSQINSSIAASLSGLSGKELGIPIGSLTGLALLNGRGPKISAIISITGSAQTNFINSFDEAGINQTRHQIFLKTTVNLLVVFPTKTLSTAYTYTTLAAETIIIGKVPAFFAGITQK